MTKIAQQEFLIFAFIIAIRLAGFYIRGLEIIRSRLRQQHYLIDGRPQTDGLSTHGWSRICFGWLPRHAFLNWWMRSNSDLIGVSRRRNATQRAYDMLCMKKKERRNHQQATTKVTSHSTKSFFQIDARLACLEILHWNEWNDGCGCNTWGNGLERKRARDKTQPVTVIILAANKFWRFSISKLINSHGFQRLLDRLLAQSTKLLFAGSVRVASVWSYTSCKTHAFSSLGPFKRASICISNCLLQT